MVVALVYSIGVHWAFLQRFARTTILADNLTTGSFSAAFQRTFDGEYPRSLCRTMAEGEETEKKSVTLRALKQLEGLSQSVVFALFPPASSPPIAGEEACFEALAYAPPTPPPRSV